MELKDYALALPNPEERCRALAALDEAEQLPIETDVLDEIEARFGDGLGQVDLDAFMARELTAHARTDEFQALMTVARLIRIRIAFIKSGESDALYVRLDKLQ